VKEKSNELKQFKNISNSILCPKSVLSSRLRVAFAGKHLDGSKTISLSGEINR
jgi:hypothetical protein